MQGRLDRLDPAGALGLELALAILDLVFGLQNGLIRGTLLLQETHPQVDPRGELREVVDAYENVHEANVPAPVDLRRPLLQSSLRLRQILLSGLQILLRVGYLPVELVHLVEGDAFLRQGVTLLRPDLHQALLGFGDLLLRRRDILVGSLSSGRNPRSKNKHADNT